jgi:hypothetical protein
MEAADSSEMLAAKYMTTRCLVFRLIRTVQKFYFIYYRVFILEQYQVKITNRFAALENFDDNVDMNRVWENIRDNIKTSAKESLGHCELQHHKPWFDDECSKLIDRRKQSKLQWLQDLSQVNGDNMNNVKREASRTFRTKTKGITKLMSLKQTVRIRISEICKGV